MLFSLLILGLVWVHTAPAQTTVGLELVADGLTHPVSFAVANDGTKRRFIVEQVGRIRILMPDGKLLDEPFLDVQDKIVPLVDAFDERGLLGLAFHPDYKNNGRFYVYYSTRMRRNTTRSFRLSGNHTAHLSEFKVSKDDPNQANPISERILLQIDQPQFNHNGGEVIFGPDGFLYLALGDGGAGNDKAPLHSPDGNGQDLSTLLGKIIRIDVNKGDPYAIPPDNPFVGKPGVREEIYAFGLRNPWRMSFDAGGQLGLITGDVQQNSWEEVNVVVKGGNYGWNKKEGTYCFDPDKPNEPPEKCADSFNGVKFTDPVIQYPNVRTKKDGKGISVAGGYVYRGKAFPAFNGSYIFGDWSNDFAKPDGTLFISKPAAQPGAMWSMEELKIAGKPNGRLGLYLLAFGEDEDRELYVLTAPVTGPTGNRDQVFKIVPAK
jgi:glucose/arabinose dehydrogenase